MYYLTQNKTIQERLVKEHSPALEKSKADFIELLTSEEVDDFEFTKRCMYESLRACPPASANFPSRFYKTTKSGGVQFTPDDTFVVNIESVCHDPTIWRAPEVFNPDRFDPASEWYLRPDNKPRSPLAFCAFSGGKRVCLGKTFADIMLGYTIPLIYYHFDFTFTNEDQATNKPYYQSGSFKVPEMKVNVH